MFSIRRHRSEISAQNPRGGLGRSRVNFTEVSFSLLKDSPRSNFYFALDPSFGVASVYKTATDRLASFDAYLNLSNDCLVFSMLRVVTVTMV